MLLKASRKAQFDQASEMVTVHAPMLPAFKGNGSGCAASNPSSLIVQHLVESFL